MLRLEPKRRGKYKRRRPPVNWETHSKLIMREIKAQRAGRTPVTYGINRRKK